MGRWGDGEMGTGKWGMGGERVIIVTNKQRNLREKQKPDTYFSYFKVCRSWFNSKNSERKIVSELSLMPSNEYIYFNRYADTNLLPKYTLKTTQCCCFKGRYASCIIQLENSIYFLCFTRGTYNEVTRVSRDLRKPRVSYVETKEIA